MKLKDFIMSGPCSFAVEAEIPIPVITRFLRGERGLSAKNMAKIVAATGGKVTYADLVDEMLEHQAARKRNNGNSKTCNFGPRHLGGGGEPI